MKKLILHFSFLAIALSPLSLFCAPPLPAALLHEPDLHIQMHNRILTRVLDQPITVGDVMKKMDINFFRQFPQYAQSKQARFQYYQAHWKNTLSDLIDKELILHDAQESKVPPPTNEVRQELEQTFGPNVMANLEKIGMTYEEATKNIEEEMILRRMLMFRAQIKAMRSVTPQMLRATYHEKKEEFIQPSQWSYRVISIRDKDEKKTQYAVEEVLKLLKNHSLDELETTIQSQVPLSPTTSVKVTELVTQQEKEISPGYKEVLDPLSPGQYSQAVEQLDRKKNKFFRIFYLQERTLSTMKTFQEMAGPIKNYLMDQKVNIETEKYISDLKKKYGIDTQKILSSLPEGFEPFTIHQITK